MAGFNKSGSITIPADVLKKLEEAKSTTTNIFAWQDWQIEAIKKYHKTLDINSISKAIGVPRNALKYKIGVLIANGELEHKVSFKPRSAK